MDAADRTLLDRHETAASVVLAALLAGGAGTRFERPDGTHKLAAGLAATSTECAESVFERALRHVRLGRDRPDRGRHRVVVAAA